MTAAKPSSNQADLLLWIAGGAIAAVGTAWLVITQPWKGGGEEPEPTARARYRSFGGDVAGTDGRGRGSCRRRRRRARGTLDNPLRMARARIRRRHADRARRVQRVDVVLARPEGRAGQRGGPRRPHEGRGRPRPPRRDGARSRAFRRRARDRRAHSLRPARPRGRKVAGAEDLPGGRCRSADARPRCRCRSPKSRASRASRRAGAARPRNRRSIPSSRRARRSTRRWPKAGS